MPSLLLALPDRTRPARSRSYRLRADGGPVYPPARIDRGTVGRRIIICDEPRARASGVASAPTSPRSSRGSHAKARAVRDRRASASSRAASTRARSRSSSEGDEEYALVSDDGPWTRLASARSASSTRSVDLVLSDALTRTISPTTLAAPHRLEDPDPRRHQRGVRPPRELHRVAKIAACSTTASASRSCPARSGSDGIASAYALRRCSDANARRRPSSPSARCSAREPGPM